MNRVVKWLAISVGAILVIVFGLLCVMAGGPKDAIQMVRFAFPYMHLGKLKVGEGAPDVQLVSLDGATRFNLREHLAGRPLVLVFGSFT